MRFLILLVLCSALFTVHAQRSKRIHAKAFIADTHNDILMLAMEGRQIDTDLRGKTQTDVDRLIKANYAAQIFSVFCDERYGDGTAFKFANREIDSLYAIAGRNNSRMSIVISPEQLMKARQQHKLAALIGVEGGHMIEGRMDYLDSLYNRGMRYLTLTWNNSTPWASSAADESKDSLPFHHKGLSDFGREVVRHMNQLGVMVDLSHVGEQTFRDAIEVSVKPVIASHSSVYSLCPVPRNLKDYQIKAIAKTGGVVFINYYSGFLDSTYLPAFARFQKRHAKETDSLTALKWPAFDIGSYLSSKYKSEVEELRPPISTLIDHIDYVRRLVGADHVGLGSDFDGIESSPKGLDDVTDISKITAALVNRGFSKKEIRNILGENFIRVFKANSAKSN